MTQIASSSILSGFTLAASRAARVLVRSEGENFCNGADVLEFAKLQPKIVHSSFRLLESSVQGMAAGGGLELALACGFSRG
jgi:enoyl-CoA hydratase/carnithine racemase